MALNKHEIIDCLWAVIQDFQAVIKQLVSILRQSLGSFPNFFKKGFQGLETLQAQPTDDL